jgi:hypothetical protein
MQIKAAAFRSRRTGEVFEAGLFHDLACLPVQTFEGQEWADEWEAGFVTFDQQFLDRQAAGRAAGVQGALRSYQI